MADQGTATYTLQDYNREKTTSAFNVGSVTDVTLPGILSGLGNLEAGIVGISLLTVFKKSLSVYENKTGTAKPTIKTAQRETRWIVHYHDSQANFGLVPNVGFGKSFVVSIGGADFSLLATDSDFADLTGTNMAAFKTAFQAVVLSPYGGSTVIDEIEFTGRKG